MPKKHHKPYFTKPVIPAHHTLASNGPHQNDRSRGSAATAADLSVNDLISHLRRTQVASFSSEDGPSSASRPFVSPRSVHPSLRNLLELPETPSPRPRPDARRGVVGRRPLRRAPGPPPPESWLSGNVDGSEPRDEDQLAADDGDFDRVIYRLERLPGAMFPGKRGLVHTVLKSMALNWTWHLEYDGPFLSQLPSHLKVLMLSYVAVYARGQPLKGRTRGLKPLYLTESDYIQIAEPELAPQEDGGADADTTISRLDLSGALGYWMTFKQLTSELVVSSKAAPVTSHRAPEKSIPASWDEEVESDERGDASTQHHVPSPAIPKAISQGLRFNNLRFLSFAHPHPAAASWNSLLQLISRLSTITHLSLAHWPTPTRTPNAANARIRHPVHRSLTFSYSGTDNYAALDNNWAEAAGLLRQLSRSTYCLKWLDLEGCADWLPALSWTGTDPDGQPYRPGTSGPEWNGSWRDVEWVGLGPGWVPDLEDESESHADQGTSWQDAAVSPSRSLASSVHSPFQNPDSDLSWDVEKERIKYRRAKELEAYRVSVHTAVDVHRQILGIRREDRGKWVHFSLGIEDLDTELVKRMLGPEYSRITV
ncbi:hypothetical protein NUU61_008504 [Penicillium alfredii]|uniref:Tafazzin n=1 Tax=Penicillium alfredii TaxID=1506179 RepID=A0A9W9JWD5_9EURO|nr:uncharacterized protein NUU61_008504 [Penicillium alfredii]KAJ5083925.1 hypothetical protein NUU61_008504 [Penicillium alfredii]